MNKKKTVFFFVETNHLVGAQRLGLIFEVCTVTTTVPTPPFEG